MAFKPPDEISYAELQQLVQVCEATIEQKLQEIEEQRREIAVLHAMQNTKVPISSLPDELLIEIFLDALSSIPDEAQHWWLHRLTRICCRWRNVTNSTPILWSHLGPKVCSEPSLVQLYLSRSAKTPLDVFITQQTDARSLVILLTECHRVRDLSIVLDWDDGPPSAYGFDYQCSLILTSVLRQSALRSLTLSRVVVPWETLLDLPPTTIHLDISQNLDPISHSRERCGQLLGILHKLPQLEVVRLCDALPASDEGVVGSTVSLPRLKQLTIIDRQHVALLFFQSLSFPTTTRIRLETKLESYQVVPTCTTLLFQMCSISLTASPQLTALVSFDNTKRKLFHVAVCAFGKCTGCNSCYLCFKFYTTSPSVLDIWSHIVHHPATKAAFSCFKSLHLDGSQVNISSEMLIEMLSLTPNLETLNLMVPVRGSLPAVLRISRDGTVPVPKLKNLELHYALTTKSSRSGYLDVAVLCRCLEMRQAHGYTLASLLVCHIHRLTTPDVFNRLRLAVGILDNR